MGGEILSVFCHLGNTFQEIVACAGFTEHKLSHTAYATHSASFSTRALCTLKGFGGAQFEKQSTLKLTLTNTSLTKNTHFYYFMS